jgi:hypothetical protein
MPQMCHFSTACVSALLLSGVAQLVSAQRPGTSAPRVFIEGFHANDSLSLQAAAALRLALAQRGDSMALRVITTGEIEAHRATGAPDDFGQAWGWADLREAGRAYRVHSIVDVVAIRSARGITLTASRIRPARSGRVVALPSVHGPTLNAAVSALVTHLLADTVLLRPVSSIVPDT